VNNLQAEIRKITRLTEFVKNDLKNIVGVEAVRDSKANFREGGFDGKKWTPRKNKNRKGKRDTKVLTDTGDLGDSINYNADFNNVEIGTNLTWAKVHNEGGHAGRGKGFTMSKRQFLGVTPRMEKKITDKILKELNKILQ
jgi:phage virion morphogenesis protein